MGQVLRGGATTTTAVRRAVRHGQGSLGVLARRHGVNPKTVAEWRKRGSAAALPTGPKRAGSTALSAGEGAAAVAFRRHAPLPPDGCLCALQAAVPRPTRPALHRRFQRHGVPRPPEVEGAEPDKRKFKAYPAGHSHIDIAGVRTEQGRLYLPAAIDRTSKFASAEPHGKVARRL